MNKRMLRKGYKRDDNGDAFISFTVREIKGCKKSLCSSHEDDDGMIRGMMHLDQRWMVGTSGLYKSTWYDSDK